MNEVFSFVKEFVHFAKMMEWKYKQDSERAARQGLEACQVCGDATLSGRFWDSIEDGSRMCLNCLNQLLQRDCPWLFTPKECLIGDN